MLTGKIAVPTQDAGGLAGQRSGHFGHCRFFTLIDIDKGDIIAVDTLTNKQHQPGGCASIVQLMQENNVSTVVASGMGNGPYTKFNRSGINVLYADRKIYPDVQSVIEGLQKGSILSFNQDQLCTGNGNCHEHGKIASKLTS